MLRPTKHSHPDQTVINLSVLILKKIRKSRIEEFSKLQDFAKKSLRGGEFLFLPALNFIFLLGLIEYRPKTDVVEYIGPNETI